MLLPQLVTRSLFTFAVPAAAIAVLLAMLSAPVRDMREALVDPQTLHNKMIMEDSTLSDRTLKFIASPIQMSGAATGILREPPRLGQHTEEVLAEARALIEVVTL